MICSVENCDKTKIMARGLCTSHYKKWYRYGDTNFIKAREPHPLRIVKCKVCKLEKQYEAKGMCKNCYQKQWQKNRPNRRNERLLKTFGISEKDFDRMLDIQDGLCAICNTQSKRTLHIDHDHKTGKIRGLLCYPCNAGLGYFYDNINYIESAKEYLKYHAVN